VWGLDHDGGELARIDPARNAIVERVAVPRSELPEDPFPFGFVVGGGFGWVALGPDNVVRRFTLASGASSSYRVGPTEGDDMYPIGLALVNGTLWVANHRDGSVTRIEPQTGAIETITRIGAPGLGGPGWLAAGASGVWVTFGVTAEVAQLSAASGALLRTVSVEPYGSCGQVAVDAEAVWVASSFCPGRRGVTRVDPTSGQVVAHIPMGFAPPFGVVSAYGSLWLTTGRLVREEPRALVRVDPATNRIVGYLQLPPSSAFIKAAGGSLWVHAAGSVLRIQPEP